MRAVLYQDLAALACCMVTMPEHTWRTFARRKIRLAHAADLYRRQTGSVHACFGDGTLGAAVVGHPQGGEAPLDRGAFGRAMLGALEEILRFREAYPVAHETQRGTEGS